MFDGFFEFEMRNLKIMSNGHGSGEIFYKMIYYQIGNVDMFSFGCKESKGGLIIGLLIDTRIKISFFVEGISKGRMGIFLRPFNQILGGILSGIDENRRT